MTDSSTTKTNWQNSHPGCRNSNVELVSSQLKFPDLNKKCEMDSEDYLPSLLWVIKERYKTNPKH